MTHKRKNVFLIHPPISRGARYRSKIGVVGGNHIPLGLYSLAAYIRKNGYAVSVCDGEAGRLTIPDILKRLGAYSASFVGITATTVTFARAQEMATAIKEHFPDVTIVLGGAHVSAVPDEAMAGDVFDFGVIGEGEITFLELLNSLCRNEDVSSLPGLVYKKNKSIHKTPPRAFIDNLDDLPFPAYDLIEDLNAYIPPPSNYRGLPAVNVVTSRGCPHACTFCSRTVFGTAYRARSAKVVFEELKYLMGTLHVKEIIFMDDTFVLDKKRIYELFALLKGARIFFRWTCLAHINNVDRDFLAFIKENGCWNIGFGIESGDESILRLVNKNISLQRIREVIGWCHGLKIKTRGFFMIGHPSETRESIEKTITFACDLNLYAANVGFNTPFPGTQQYGTVDMYGTLEKDWSKFSGWYPVFVPHGLTREILFKKQKAFYLRFYMRLKILLQYIPTFISAAGLRRIKSIANLIAYVLPGST